MWVSIARMSSGSGPTPVPPNGLSPGVVENIQHTSARMAALNSRDTSPHSMTETGRRKPRPKASPTALRTDNFCLLMSMFPLRRRQP